MLGIRCSNCVALLGRFVTPVAGEALSRDSILCITADDHAERACPRASRLGATHHFPAGTLGSLASSNLPSLITTIGHGGSAVVAAKALVGVGH